MKNRIVKIIGFSLAFALIGSTGASADFEGPFAPNNWTFSGVADGNSLSVSQMQITSSNIGGGVRTASYSINVPGNTSYISFDFHYITYDRDGSHFDLPYYSIAGVRTNIVPDNCGGIINSCVAQNGTRTGSLTLTNVAGQSFGIIQEALDGILGSAIITISNFNAGIRYSDYLIGVNPPTFQIDSKGQATCSSGSYKFASGPSANINSFVYTLFINGQPVSRLASDPAGELPAHLFSSIKHSVLGVAAGNKAIWDVSTLSNYDAYCWVTVANSGATMTSISNETTDSVKLAAAAAKEKAWDLERAAAVAANFSKEARESRKRRAARG